MEKGVGWIGDPLELMGIINYYLDNISAALWTGGVMPEMIFLRASGAWVVVVLVLGEGEELGTEKSRRGTIVARVEEMWKKLRIVARKDWQQMPMEWRLH